MVEISLFKVILIFKKVWNQSQNIQLEKNDWENQSKVLPPLNNNMTAYNYNLSCSMNSMKGWGGGVLGAISVHYISLFRYGSFSHFPCCGYLSLFLTPNPDLDNNYSYYFPTPICHHFHTAIRIEMGHRRTEDAVFIHPRCETESTKREAVAEGRIKEVLWKQVELWRFENYCNNSAM